MIAEEVKRLLEDVETKGLVSFIKRTKGTRLAELTSWLTDLFGSSVSNRHRVEALKRNMASENWPTCACGCGRPATLDTTYPENLFRKFNSPSCTTSDTVRYSKILHLLRDIEWLKDQASTLGRPLHEIAAELTTLNDGISVQPAKLARILKANGIEYCFDKQAAQDKRKKTNLEVYGEEFQLRRTEIREVMSEKLTANASQRVETAKRNAKERYGRESFQGLHIPEESMAILNSPDELAKVYKELGSSESIAQRFGCSPSLVLIKLRMHGIELTGTGSAFEDEVYESIRPMLNEREVLRHDRKKLGGKEVDILVDGILGIELHGLYWHSHNPFSVHPGIPDPNYHKTKHDIALKSGVKLLQFFSDEWVNGREACVNIIQSNLGSNERVFARKTTCREISSKEAKNFCDEYHLAGYAQCKYKFGLFVQDELVQVMTFARPRFEKVDAWEIIRLCSKSGITVVGGASKLLTHFIKEIEPAKVISYSDNRVGNGATYEKMGFTLTKELDPGYFWFFNGERKHRFNFRKSRLKGFPNYSNEKTEKEIMFEVGARILFDAGHRKWELDLR